MRILVVLLIVVPTSVCLGQELKWYQGSVVLADKSVHVGAIAIQPAYDLVLLNDSVELHVLPAHKVSAVHFYDDEEDINRKFLSLMLEDELYSRYVLYETVVYGEAMVVRHLLSKKSQSQDHKDGYNYFVRLKGELIHFREFQKRGYPNMASLCPSLPGFIKANKLVIHKPAHVFQIVKFFNQQTRRQSISAI